MKKILLTIGCGLLLATTASASLWSYYTSRGEQLPSISERAIIAETCGIQNYSGTYDQNIELEKCLESGQRLGIALPSVAALFETSLQNSVASDATSMTLVSATLKNGNSLDGLYGFIIDEGGSNEEFILCNASSTALTSCLRGIDPVDGKTEVSALKYSHRRGASIKITDYPILGIMRRVLNGDEGLPNFIYYDASTTLPTLEGQLATKYYVDNVGAGGFTSANVSTTRGLSVDGSSPEKVGVNASSTQGMAFDSSGALYQKVSSTQGLQTDSNGIGINYAYDNTWTGTNTFSGTTTLATTTLSSTTVSSLIVSGSATINGSSQIGFRNMTVVTTTSSWSVPAGVTKVRVRVVGGGGNGGSLGEVAQASNGGGGGGYAEKIVDVSATSTISITVGGSAATSSFSSFLSASGGQTTIPGIGIGGDLNAYGSAGGTAISETISGHGGNSVLGGGATAINSASYTNGNNGYVYGGGGSGCKAINSSGQSCIGGSGAQGVVIIEY